VHTLLPFFLDEPQPTSVHTLLLFFLDKPQSTSMTKGKEKQAKGGALPPINKSRRGVFERKDQNIFGTHFGSCTLIDIPT
jgi:hypothetical protein